MRTDDSRIPDLVGLAGAATILGISRQAAHKMALAGQLRGQQIDDGGTWVFRREAVEDAAGLVAWDSLLPQWLIPEDSEAPAARTVAGFGVSHRVQADEARTVWEKLTLMGARNPRLALMLGAAIAAPFLASSERRPFWVLAAGPAASGKSAALAAAASVVGDPRILIGGPQMKMTPARLRRRTSRLLLPVFLEGTYSDELVHMTTAASGRAYVGRDGHVVTEAPPRSVVFSTLEQPRSLEDMREPRKTDSNVVVVDRPMESADDARAVKRLAMQASGWPLEWLRNAAPAEASFQPENQFNRFDSWLRTPALHPTTTHVAMAIEGARVLETLVGANSADLAEAAFAASRVVLADFELMVHGL